MNGTVTIVGSGPTGLLLAGDLAAAGVSVTVIEKRPAGISNLTRAFGVHARTMEQLDARGLADALVPTGRKVTELRFFDSLALDFSGLHTRFPYLLATPQFEVEKLLLRRAVEHGVTFRHGARVTGLSQDDEGVTVEFAGQDGTTETLCSAYVVGTDGTHSAVREAIGLPFPGHSVIKSIVLADVRLTEEPDRAVAVNGSERAIAFAAPFSDGYWRVGGWQRTHADVADDEPLDLAEVRAVVEQVFGTDFGMHDARWTSRFHSDERQVPTYRVGRVLLAGDAAHTHSPVGGQGMNTGLQDAANLGWKLAAVVNGQEGEELLDTYQAERHPIGRDVIRSSGGMLRFAMAHTPAWRALRTVASLTVGRLPAAATRRLLGRLSGIGYAYGPGVRRVPDIRLQEGRLYEALRAGTFVRVVPRGQEEPGDERTTIVHWASDRQDTLLVRPDGYTA
ncbi:FAD-dependent monooxygenase [Streptomyces sp. NBC_01433]|uniref:FAD-dependent monooxygenase n=1 Tax=Streptomyces sp. NBC_01433 TaxID=2903864 RepID=UPI002255E595|nr:FAD-dependent monooxygenase [Streptomyces sp. NBC_01433]MCX4676949.1 FAD-dependent monooxygenase [Streptomyces sp. NBC_01433]